MQFDDVQKAGKDQMENATAVAASVTRSLQAMATEATDYSKRSLETTSSYFEKMMGVKSVETAVQVQSDFAKSQIEGFVAQATKMGELYKAMASQVFKPMENVFAQAKGAIQQ